MAAVVVRLSLTFRENVKLLEGSRRQALTDALTGLANRRRLMDDLAERAAAATEEEPMGLLLFDLDGFKQYNDRFGHPVGDALLARLGRQLDAAVRPSGRAYRLGGDEFAVIAGGSPEELAEMCERGRQALTERGQGFDVSSSCGLVTLPLEAADVTHALNLADERLYAEKGVRRRRSLERETSRRAAPGAQGARARAARPPRRGGHAGPRPGRAPGPAQGGARPARARRRAARHRQDRRARGHPRQGGPAGRPRVGVRAPAHARGRSHPERRSDAHRRWPRWSARATRTSTARATRTPCRATTSRSGHASWPSATPSTR